MTARLAFCARRDVAAFTFFFWRCVLFAFIIQLELLLFFVVSLALTPISREVNSLKRGGRTMNA